MSCFCISPDPFDNEFIDDNDFKHYEGYGLVSVYQSIMGELGDKKESTLHSFLSHLHPDAITNNKSNLDELHSISKLHLHLSKGIDSYYASIINGTIDSFEPNSIDSVLALLIIGIYYGVRSSEYKKIKGLLFKGSYYDIHYLEVPIENIMHLRKKFHAPEKNIWGAFYNENKDPNCYSIAENCTIAIFSDWATGTKSAICLADAVATFLPDYVIHLGDVYYSGTVSETKDRLVQPIKNHILSKSRNAQVFMVPGNHDYYSGTKGVKYALKAFGQNASFFSLYNSKLQIEGLDTGFNDSDCFSTFFETAHNTTVMQSELDWHLHRIKTAQQSNRKLILLSHHQPVSPWRPAGNIDNKTSPVNPLLFSQFKDVMPQIDMWMYGHDHSFAILEPYTYDNATLKAGRLIGNGACQYRENALSYYETPVPTSFDVNPDIVPCPVVKSVFPGAFDNLLNASFVILNITSSSVNIAYYELPQTQLGVFGLPNMLYSEDMPLV